VNVSTETIAGCASWRDRTTRSALATPEPDHMAGGHVDRIEQGVSCLLQRPKNAWPV
jgi:hypothetical protein